MFPLYLFDDPLAEYFSVCEIEWRAVVYYFHTCYWHGLWSYYQKKEKWDAMSLTLCVTPEIHTNILFSYLIVHLRVFVDVCGHNLNHFWTVTATKNALLKMSNTLIHSLHCALLCLSLLWSLLTTASWISPPGWKIPLRQQLHKASWGRMWPRMTQPTRTGSGKQ